MHKCRFIGASFAMALLLAETGTMLHAQDATAQDAQRQSALTDIRASIIRTIGAQNETVEVVLKGNVLTVWRPNSNMNQSTHAGRDNEAMVIAGVVSNAISGKPEFSKLVTIWVRYVVRSRPSGRT